VATEICNELTVHTQLEEQVFYPAAREALEESDLIDEASVEHQVAKELIEPLIRMCEKTMGVISRAHPVVRSQNFGEIYVIATLRKLTKDRPATKSF